ncbi:MAG: FtsQ-type POTRA domain-containing protein [Bradyrhizobium sp.]|nr:MAG: FtsQ-type POTRA domain-containing protein [Bradyrhizobium sp.]
MDGGGRVVQSLSGGYGLRPPAALGIAPRAAFAPARVLLRGERARRGPTRWTLHFAKPAPRGLGLTLAAALLAGVTAYGAERGGEYQAFVAREGGVGDYAARALGFGVSAVTISGQSQLSENEILALAGVDGKTSLPFYDAGRARKNLEAQPLIKQAGVRKLYPDRIVIDIVERTPAGLWQKDGEISAVAADGTAIDTMRDKYQALPFVVGEGANAHLDEYQALLDASAELRPRIVAGVRVGDRRWTLKMRSGVDVELPEVDPLAAMATLLTEERQSRLLERDILSVDLRVPGRVFVRLSEEAAAARDAAKPKKVAQ